MEDNGNDPIAISAVINTFLVKKILVDDGSVVKVLIWKAFKEMGLDESQLKPTGPIYDFANQSIKAKGIIMLLVTLGKREHIVIVTPNFLVVNQPSTYNAIIDRPLMKKASMVITVYYLIVKFLIPLGSDI